MNVNADIATNTGRRASAEGIYRRVSVRMYGDAKFMRLSPLLASGQALWLYLLTGPHTGPIPGVFIAGRAAIAEALAWESEAFDKALAEVFAEGLAEFDPKTRLWLIPKAIHHNAPPNPNVVTSWRTHWMQLPECALRDRIGEHLLAALSEMSEPFAKAFAKVSGMAFGKAFDKPSPKHMAKQEAGSRKQEQEQEQEQEKQQEGKPSASSAKPTRKAPTIPPCPCEAIKAIYNEVLPNLPAARTMTDDRKRLMIKRWSWIFNDRKSDGMVRATTEAEALKWMREYFERASDIDFLMGKTPRSPEHANWSCDIDYLMKDKCLVMVTERT